MEEIKLDPLSAVEIEHLVNILEEQKKGIFTTLLTTRMPEWDSVFIRQVLTKLVLIENLIRSTENQKK